MKCGFEVSREILLSIDSTGFVNIPKDTAEAYGSILLDDILDSLVAFGLIAEVHKGEALSGLTAETSRQAYTLMSLGATILLGLHSPSLVGWLSQFREGYFDSSCLPRGEGKLNLFLHGEAFEMDGESIDPSRVTSPEPETIVSSVHRVVRLMLAGHCPQCGVYGDTGRFRAVANRYLCPACGFMITEDEATAALTRHNPLLERSVEIFEQWRSTREVG
jgi:predicted RNA-binding Zn-ribbon protein involved in translation (DUF1610 family)